MIEERSNRRSYTSPLRHQQKEITRSRILEAVAAIINEGRILDFNIQEVADKAGVSYGSVYRHFPTRESLLEALYEEASEIMTQSSPFTLNLLEDIPATVGKTIAMFEKQAAMVQAFTIALLANNVQPKIRRQRDQKIQQMVMESNPHMAPEAAKQYSAIISHLNSSLTWATLKQRFGLDSEETVAAVNWALQTLIQNLTHRKEDES